jgi:nifR3 family TIM-barrel protein
MAGVAEKLNECPADIIDINMGCPTPKITKNGEGSALMLKPGLVADIVREVSNVSNKPVTVKIRKGWDDDSVNAALIAQLAEKNGARAVAVHGRTREQFYSGKADWDIIKYVKQAVSIPVIGNGDIFAPQDAEKMLEHTSCDAVLIGRGSQGNPWIFSRVIEYLRSGKLVPEPPFEIKINMIIRHMDMLSRLKGEHSAVYEMRKHIAWYIKGMKNAAVIRDRIFKTASREEVLALLDELLQLNLCDCKRIK